VLISHPKVNQPQDFEELARWIEEIDPRVHVHIRKDLHYARRKWLLALRRTMVFSPFPTLKFRLIRGAVYQGSSMTKTAETEGLERAGVPVPPYAVLTEQQPKVDVSHLDEYVVVKPDRGGRGANIRIMRSSNARWEPHESRIAGKSSRTIVQRFIYTGPWPVSYRVTSLFGQALFVLRVEASHDRPGLAGPGDFKSTSGLSIVSNSRRCTFQLAHDEEIIRFAEDAHRAFPSIPLLGIDVVRDALDGRLFVLEVNSSGYVWHFTSPLGMGVQSEFNLNFESQFDGRRKAARILAAKAMELAR
jgi:hypothetical protein